MNRTKFYNILKDLGEFRCEHDLRKFKNKAKKNSKLDAGLYLNYFGRCKDGVYHSCEFELKTEPVIGVAYYYKVVEVDGEKIRQRGGRPMSFAGRGRPSVKNKKK